MEFLFLMFLVCFCCWWVLFEIPNGKCLLYELVLFLCLKFLNVRIKY